MIIRKLIGHAIRLFRNERGVSALEFAMIAPVLAMMIVGVAEVGSSLIKDGRVSAVAGRLGDLITREKALTRSDVNRLLQAAPSLVGDASFGERARIIVSAVSVDRNGSRLVAWQQGDAGRLMVRSHIGEEKGPATLPAEVSVARGETLIAVEVFATRGQGLLGGSSSSDCGDAGACIYKTAFFRGRSTDLAVVASR